MLTFTQLLQGDHDAQPPEPQGLFVSCAAPRGPLLAPPALMCSFSERVMLWPQAATQGQWVPHADGTQSPGRLHPPCISDDRTWNCCESDISRSCCCYSSSSSRRTRHRRLSSNNIAQSSTGCHRRGRGPDNGSHRISAHDRPHLVHVRTRSRSVAEAHVLVAVHRHSAGQSLHGPNARMQTALSLVTVVVQVAQALEVRRRVAQTWRMFDVQYFLIRAEERFLRFRQPRGAMRGGLVCSFGYSAQKLRASPQLGDKTAAWLCDFTTRNTQRCSWWQMRRFLN